MRQPSLVLLAMSLLLVACGGGDAALDAMPTFDAASTVDAAPTLDAMLTLDAVPDPDAMSTLDAATADAASADAASACILQPTYADVTMGTLGSPFAFVAFRTNAGDFGIGLYRELTNIAPKVALLIWLIENAGAFSGGFTTGTFDPVDSGACGGCLEGYGGYMSTITSATEIYQATAGTLTISTFDPAVPLGTSRIEGVFNNVTLQGFDVATQTTIPNCITTVNNLSFVWDVTWPQ